MIELSSSRKAADYLRPLFHTKQEEFWVLALNSLKQVINKGMIFRGTVDGCNVHPRDVFRFAIESNAASIIVAHNHPSGNPSPSEMDKHITKRLMKAGQLLQLEVVDHIIVVAQDKSFYSFADNE